MHAPELIEGEHYEIATSANGDTLWVNGDDGLCWARFSKRWGIDVHRSQATGPAETECLYCTHKEATEADWRLFRAEVLKHHSVQIEPDAIIFP